MLLDFATCAAQMLWIQSSWAVDVEWHVDMLSLQRLLIFTILKRKGFRAAFSGSTFGSSFWCIVLKYNIAGASHGPLELRTLLGIDFHQSRNPGLGALVGEPTKNARIVVCLSVDSFGFCFSRMFG